MKGIQKVEIQEVSVKDPKTFIQKFGKDKGKEGQLWNIGLKIEGEWYNGALFDKSHVDAMEQRSEAELYFFEEEYQGKMYQKWRPVKDKDRENDEILKRLDALEERIKELEAELQKLTGTMTSSMVNEQSVNLNEPQGEQAEETLKQEDMDDLPF